MITPTLIELVLKGFFTKLDLSFLDKLLIEAREIRFNSPENMSVFTFDEVKEVFYSNPYVDLVINTDKWDINGSIVKHVFINLDRSGNESELLFFFDINDLNNNFKVAIDLLNKWVDAFAKTNNFHYFICQMDNADEDEYYFDSKGLGPLYIRITQ